MSLLHHVAPSVYHEVEESHDGDLNGKEACPEPHALGGFLMVGMKANVDIHDPCDADCDSEEPMEEIPYTPHLNASAET